jgi:hypothetical protein
MSVSYDFSAKKAKERLDEIRIVLQDRIEGIVPGDDSLSCKVVREISTSPQSIISISVAVKVYFNIKKKYSGKVPWDEMDVEKELFENCKSFFVNPMSRISLLIANITSSFAGSPMITPSRLIMPDEEE